MKPALLDVNVLIALLDPAHEFHPPAHAWFRRNRRHRWATCPLTQNGCLRIMSKPSYPFPGLSIGRMREILAELTSVSGHIFWPDSISILDKTLFRLDNTNAKQITDIYLLGLASANDGRVATFDRSIAPDHVIGCGQDALEVIGT